MPNPHHWHFFRAGGFDQVLITSGQDFLHLDRLDQKLWVALACPVHGIEFDPETLKLLDLDNDGRIRAPEVIAAAKWTGSLLKNPDELLESKPALPLANIKDETPEGKAILASAKQILVNLGLSDSATISPDQTADTTKIFANTAFNGDGIIPADAADDPALKAIITDIVATLGPETDRSGKPGINQKKLDLFFADAAALIAWHDQTKSSTLPLGANAASAAAAIKAVASKIEDYFTRCRLAVFDPRSVAILNRAETDYTALAARELSAAVAEIAAFPIAKIGPDQPLPLNPISINPAWHSAINTLVAVVITPLLGEKQNLTESEWAKIVAIFAPVDAWLAAKAGAAVESLGLERIRAILATANARENLAALIAKDAALAPEAESIANVHKLVHCHRDLYQLLNNFVSFRHFYAHKHHESNGSSDRSDRSDTGNNPGGKATFQVGTLYLDQRACELCIRVDDPARHALMAHLSRTYLAYCDLTRKGPDGTIEKMSIAAAYTAGDSDNLMVGRNGIFYDRHGRDWDATITKITENPISIRQAFFSPYKRAIRFVSDQVAKRAAAADAQATERLQNAAAAQVLSAAPAAGSATAPPPPPPPTPPVPPAKKMDVGVVAALGVALGALSTALGYFLAWLGNIPLYYIPLYFIAIILMISLPSMLIAWFKLRQRNLGPLLDANGWAVNAKAKINIPFGRSLTHTPKLPVHARRNLIDPYADSHRARNWAIIIVLFLIALLALWYFGVIEMGWPGLLPKSGYVQRREAAMQKAAVPATMPAPRRRAPSSTTSAPSGL